MRFTKFVASILFKFQDNSKSPITRCTSFESLCFVAPDIILPSTTGLKLNQLSAELFISIVNSYLFLFIRKHPFQVAGNTFPLNYLDAITFLCTPIVYWMNMLNSCNIILACIVVFSVFIEWAVLKKNCMYYFSFYKLKLDLFTM